MKSKILQFILISLIVLMISGIIMSIKDIPSNDISEIISDFENQSDFNVNGYTSVDVFNENNINILGKINSGIGNFIARAINKIIDVFFELIKKFIS